MTDEIEVTPTEEPVTDNPTPTPEPTPRFTEETSILYSVKKVLGLPPEDTSFDADIFMHINSAFFKLEQLAVVSQPFNIEDETTTWADALGEDEARLSAVKSYIYLYVKYIFDPNTNGTIHNAYKQELNEMEQRFLYACDPYYN